MCTLEQHKAAHEEYMMYNTAILQNDLIVPGAVALLYAWLATTTAALPPIVWCLGTAVIFFGFIRGHMLGKQADQLRHYLATKEGPTGWQAYRIVDDSTKRKYLPLVPQMTLNTMRRRAAGIFWGGLLGLSLGVAICMPKQKNPAPASTNAQPSKVRTP